MTKILNATDFFGIKPGMRLGNRQISGFNVPAIPPFNNLANYSERKNSEKLPEPGSLRVLHKRNNTIDSIRYQKMYSELSDFISKDSRQELQFLHQNKKLISNKSNDGSAAIENLYKIMKTPRAEAFNAKIIIEETLATLANPYIITQDFGKTPETVLPRLIEAQNKWARQELEEDRAEPVTKYNRYERKPILKTVVPFETLKKEALVLAEKADVAVPPDAKLTDILSIILWKIEYMKAKAVTDSQKSKDAVPIDLQKMLQLNQLQKQNIDLAKQIKIIDFRKGHTCPGASIEFDLADKKPAEFVRYVEGLTSPAKCVKTKIKYSNIADDLPAAISQLYDQKVDYKKLNAQEIEVTLRPDDNAYPRAVIQEYGRAEDSRSTTDSLLQSTFMQTGSAKTYNSLTDLRSEDTGHGRGLNQDEGAFVESIVDYDDGKNSVTYMQLDDDITQVLNYNFNPEITEAMLTETLKSDKNIMVGFLTDVAPDGKLATENGHEILLTGLIKTDDGEKFFKYNDTDDGNHYAPSYIPVKELIRTLHHANLPKSIAKKYIPVQKYPRLMFVEDYRTLQTMNKAPQNPVSNFNKTES